MTDLKAEHLECLPFAAFVADRSMRYRAANTRAVAMCGRPLAELLSLSILDLIAPDSREAGQRHFARLLTHGSADGEIVALRPDGSRVRWAVHAVRLSDDAFLGCCRDVSAQRAEAAQLRQQARMLEQTNELARVGGWWADLETGELHWTEVTRRIHEVADDYQPELATAIAFYQAGEHRERLRAAVEQALREGRSYSLESIIVTARGRELWVRTIGKAELRQGRPALLYGAFQDIDAAKRTEQALLEARRAAEEATAAKSLFVARMSHELRTPLAGVLGLADILAANELPTPARESVERLRRAARGLRDLVNDAIDHERLAVGGMEIERIPLQPREVLQACDELLAAQVAAKSLRWQSSCDPGLPQWVLGDPTRLRQVLLNLMANALRFTPPGGMVATAMVAHGDGERLRCTVTDDGPGVPLERQEAIFQPFVQADPAVGRTHGGSGLGLSICRQLVERMGGAIGVDSTPGLGSTFWFEIPLAACPAAERPGDGSSRVVRGGRLGLRILLAEDDDICRFAVARMLETLGCTHLAVGDGHAALSAWESGGWDAVLMDLHMPVMDGPTAIRAIRDRQGGTAQHIIALTAATDPAELARCREAGADAVAAKPLSLSGLRRALRGLAQTRDDS